MGAGGACGGVGDADVTDVAGVKYAAGVIQGEWEHSRNKNPESLRLMIWPERVML